MIENSFRLANTPIKFGTDGWRGVLGVDITLEKMMMVAAAAAQQLSFQYRSTHNTSLIIVGYDRRFLAPEFAEAIAAAIKGCELEPLITSTPVPTPACSWSVEQRKALGALVVTASHNPPEWLGLKIKDPLGASVDEKFTEAVERRVLLKGLTIPIYSSTDRFDCRREHLEGLKEKVDISKIIKGIKQLGLKVIVDPMHGSAAGCVTELFRGSNFVEEIRSKRDPLFGGNSPEPLAPYLKELIKAVKESSSSGNPAIGIVFDGDGDRLAAIDENGLFCSAQLLMPLLIDHLARIRKLPGCVIKTVSGSDLMRLVAEDIGREVLELPVGFKHIAAAMNNENVLIGGEESGGIGLGSHIPERDALFVSLLLLEALGSSQMPLGKRLKLIKERFGESYYERIDLNLESISIRKALEDNLLNRPPKLVGDINVKDVVQIDGIKLVLANRHWLMFRFSGTEPLLRVYCEAPTKEKVASSLDWAKKFVEDVVAKD